MAIQCSDTYDIMNLLPQQQNVHTDVILLSTTVGNSIVAIEIDPCMSNTYAQHRKSDLRIIICLLKTGNFLEKISWLVVLGLNSPSRHYFSLYRAVSQREGERKEN